MSDYTKTTNFAAKDSLPSGNSGKIVKGSEIDTEFTNIQTAVATKLNINNSALTGTTTAQTLDISGNVDVDGTLETDALSLNGVTVTSTAAELNILDGVTSTAAELNILDGVTSTTAELNYVDGVTSNVQTQLNTKAPLASPTFTGTVTAAGLTVDTTTLVVDASNNRVGIGTSSPSADLSVGSTSTSSGDIHLRTTKTAAAITPSNTAAGGMDIGVGFASGGQGPLTFTIGSTEAMRIDSSGNLLAGTTNAGATGLSLFPNYNLSFSEASNLSFANVFRQTTSGATVIGSGYKHSSTGNKMASSHSSAWARTAIWAGYGAIKFYADAEATVAVGTDITPTERMRVDSTGKVLIGTTGTSFSERLTVNSNGAPYSAHLFAGSGATAPLICRNENGVSGSRSQVLFLYNSSTVGSISSSPSATGYNTSSDQRLKENIADADDAGSKVDAIQVRKFDWIADGSHQDYGMVAQELQAVAPEAVWAPADPDEMMGVDYSKLVPMLVKEIQSLRSRVAQLENN